MNDSKNPWTIISSEERYRNNWITLTHFNVITPTGANGIYGKIHFHNRAIGIFVLDENLNTYLVGQFRFPLESYSWEMPEGGGPFDEDPLDAAKRELEEETGLHAAEWSELLRMHLSNSVSDEYSVIYLARSITQHEAMPDETEELIVRRLPFNEAYDMIDRGLITDSMTVAALLRVKLLLLEGKL